MQTRPVFTTNGSTNVNFDWTYRNGRIDYRNSSLQLRRNAKEQLGLKNILEVSSASEIALGKQLSAFNLTIKTNKGRVYTVEQMFQAGKVFKDAGEQSDLLKGTALEAKKATSKLHRSGDQLVGFKLFGKEYPMNPTNVFYDWLYLHALNTSDLKDEVLKYDGFTDIRFNPKFAVNCQAMACAKYKYMYENGLLKDALSNLDRFTELEKEMTQF